MLMPDDQDSGGYIVALASLAAPCRTPVGLPRLGPMHIGRRHSGQQLAGHETMPLVGQLHTAGGHADFKQRCATPFIAKKVAATGLLLCAVLVVLSSRTAETAFYLSYEHLVASEDDLMLVAGSTQTMKRRHTSRRRDCHFADALYRH